MHCSGSFTPSPSSRHVRLASQRNKVIGNAGGCFKRLVQLAGLPGASLHLHPGRTRRAGEVRTRHMHSGTTVPKRPDCSGFQRGTVFPSHTPSILPGRVRGVVSGPTYGYIWSKVNDSSPYTRGTTLHVYDHTDTQGHAQMKRWPYSGRTYATPNTPKNHRILPHLGGVAKVKS